jgi:hypothetical protein
MTHPTNASAVSRALRKAGLLPLPEARRFKVDGVFVHRAVLGQVAVAVDFEGSKRARVLGNVLEALTDAGYVVDRHTDSHVYVAGRAS